MDMTEPAACSSDLRFAPSRFTGKERDSESNLDNFGARYNSSSVGRFMSPDPENAGANPTAPQSWNMYSYVVNNPLTFTDPTGMECVWDDGSFDAEGDPQTGSVSSCQKAGGTWIELGQNGNWSSQANSDLQNLVSDIQNGNVGSVTITTTDNSQYTTNYNSFGQAIGTSTPNGVTVFGNNTSPTPSNAGLGLVAVGEGACIVLEPCGAGEGTGAAVFGGLFLVTQGVIDLSRHFAKGGKQNILPSWAEGQRPLPGESAREDRN
jgi:RHS repeat-associated protein